MWFVELAALSDHNLVASTIAKVLGVIQLKDIIKGGIKERFAELRRMGIRTVMITGDNRLTAAAIAAEAGVDDFLAEATPEAKLKLIREHQAQAKMVAMTGDGTNDAPALAQADVAVAMNSGTQAAKDPRNAGGTRIHAQPRLADALEAHQDRVATTAARCVAQVHAQHLVDAFTAFFEGVDVALVAQDFGNRRLDLRKRHFAAGMPRLRGIADAGQHVRDRICHAHGVTSSLW